ncbi:MAG: WbqC family protein [Phenylobacterium sp.]
MPTAAIMQPTYLPYLGYFSLIAQADVFVFLDDVQFARRSWQSRNRILGAGGEVMLTVPVKKHDRETLIRDIEIADDQPWRDKHLASIRHAYAGRPGFIEGLAFLEPRLAAQQQGKLADLTCAIAQDAAAELGLSPRFVRASQLAVVGRRSDHLLSICRAVGASDYLSPMGSADYMTEDAVFDGAGFPVRFLGFTPLEYPQRRGDFTPYMSFVDALMNLGWSGLRDLLARMRG